MRTARSVAALTLALLASGACRSAGDDTASANDRWALTAPAPLPPRHGALVLAVAGKGLVLGGSDESPCPPSASCRTAPRPLRDAAVYDPAADTWTKAPPAPVGLGPLVPTSSAVVGDTAYVLVQGGQRRAFLSYDLSDRTWRRLPPPPQVSTAWFALSTLGRDVVAYVSSHDPGLNRRDHRPPDQAYDPAARRWRELPQDPLGPSSGRTMVATDTGTVLLADERPRYPLVRPPATETAVLDPRTRRWRRLPDSPPGISGSALPAGGRVVNLLLQHGAGEAADKWGRRYPYGSGVLDVRSRRWSALPPGRPDVPTGTGGPGFASGAGLVVASGVALDVATGQWTRVPTAGAAPLPRTGEGSAVLSTSTGPVVLEFGGATWRGDWSTADLSGAGLVWRPAG
ncbi:Kelch repeat-containing protein [Motilibacter deserti]|uniref:Galactose oxidase-like protein n=1 Tax=Motilibacter deserti TaxID=2714956 RepID=A0ABX0GXP5_9ACTN|nr:hypothetical protein [Motilibacter deserti]NHC15748.1 hypothetical protein [Motilibacter deserti]